MISNQVLQDTVDGIKSISRTDLCIMDTEGKPVASTISDVSGYVESVLVFAQSLAESQMMQGHQFFKVFDENQLEYIILVKGETDDAYMVGKLAAFQIQNLLVAYKERFDKDNFIKNLLLDNLLLVDIYNRSKKLHIDIEVKRIVYIIETKKDKLAQMGATVFGFTQDSKEECARKTIEACKTFFKQMGLKTQLSECGITEKELDALTAPIDKMGWHLGEHHNIDSNVDHEILILC